jgi:molybdopterin-guanine dinucleotide biosynthesis protein B
MVTAIITLVGESDSGKTMVATELIRILTEEGYRVAAVKHCPHGHDVDKEGSDTYRMALAGASTVIAVSPNKVTKIERTESDLSLELIVKALDGFDLVIAEGFRDNKTPKILVQRSDGHPYTGPILTATAAVGDTGPFSALTCFRFDEIPELATYIRNRFLTS